MTDWTDLSDSELAVGKPATESKMRALRDNPIAMGEGAPGAQRIRLGALEELEAGSIVQIDYEGAVGPSTFLTVGFMQTGTVSVDVTNSGGSGVKTVTRVRNGSATVLAAESGTIEIDVDVLPGDALEFATGSGFEATVVISTNGQRIWPAFPTPMVS